MIDSGKTFDGKQVGYEIVDDGYIIYLNGNKWITQTGKYSKLYIADGTYEENCLAHIEELTGVNTEVQDEVVESDVKNRLSALEASQAEQDELIAELAFGGESNE